MDTVAPSYQLNLDEPLIRGLAYAALHPGLRSVLLFDASPVMLRSISQIFAQMLEIVTNCQIVQVKIGSIETADDIWGQWNLNSHINSEKTPEDIDQSAIVWQPGLLGSIKHEQELRLVVIPDITQLSLAGMRACVAAMGSESLQVERHGQQQLWRPNLCWLVGCAQDKVGLVSPHLLDRITLRLTGKIRSAPNQRIEKLLACLENDDLDWDQAPLTISEEICESLRLAKTFQYHFNVNSLQRVIAYITELNVYSARREVALARLTIAEAMLSNLKELSPKTVDKVAAIIGLNQLSNKPTSLSDKKENPPELKKKPDSSKNPDKLSKLAVTPLTNEIVSKTEPVHEPNTTEVLEPKPILEFEQSENPYPEDEAPVEREAASLRLPTRRFRSKAATFGTVIGAEKTTTPHDLALVRTLLEAAKYQPIRQREADNVKGRLILSSKDLYRYQRAPFTEQMLMLVLDHTSLQDCKWREVLLPYLSWAYVERTSVCLIQVGEAKKFHELSTDTASKAEIQPEELRAKKIMGRSLLVPFISAGFEVGRGRATPLAHGLDLALQTLRHACQHGRTIIHQAMLVVISDGRGNVPLEDSRMGKITSTVGRKGFENALQVAEQIRSLDKVKVVLLNPQPQQYKDLPLVLARALGGEVVAIPSLEEEVE